MRLRNLGTYVAMLAGLFWSVLPRAAIAQVNTVNLSGNVSDPQGLVIKDARVTAKNLATGAERTAATNPDGHYEIVGLPPGNYSLTIEAEGFAKLVNPSLLLTLGTAAVFNASMTLKSTQLVVSVSGEPELVETSKTDVSQTVNTNQILNLPINGRNYINFTLLDSQANRDSAPSIGAAPTSGLNFGGQRGRSNEVSVDGADEVDNSVNGVRTTVSQEAVQEFQLLTSNYMPEYGRAIGGVVNIVTKSGSNETHGNLFGFLRHKSLQAQDPFSVEVNPATGAVRPAKQGFTRVQAGATIGGPIQKDKTFYFFSFETTRRQETGFTDIGANNFGLVPTVVPFLPAPLNTIPLLLTPDQAAFVSNPAVTGTVPGLITAGQLAVVAGSGAQFGLTGFDFGAIDANKGVPPCAAPTPQGLFPCFPFPVPGPSRPFSPSRPGSFVPLVSLVGNYPVKEGTSLYSLRLDHLWNSKNSSFVRASVSPSLVTGIQVNAQNQNFGENAGSRTSLQQTRDMSIAAQHVTNFSSALFNEARFQYARRGLHYGFAQLPGGSNVGINMAGFAFFGREPFSTVDRIERRTQFTDNITWIAGRHTIKFGGDFNLIQLRSSKAQIFELNFGGLFNFGGLDAGTVGFPASVNGVAVPGFSAPQIYGLGLPSSFDQGVGHSSKPFDNKTLGAFIQDSWKMNSRFTFNYGVRYDIEFTPTFTPSTAINAVAEPALHVLEGLPVYTKAVQPRAGFAWDPTGSGKTVIRAAYGLFFDHPLLAVAFDSTTADGAGSTQLTSILGQPSGLDISNPANQSAFNAASLFQGILNTGAIPGVSYLPNQQRFDPLNSPFFNNQTFVNAGFPVAILPFTLPVAKNFVYASAQQGNLTVERELSKDFKISAAYTYTHGVHLNRPRNINSTIPGLLVSNALHAVQAGLINPGTNPLFVQVPAGAVGQCVNSPSTGSVLLNVPQILATGFSAANCNPTSVVGAIGTPGIFNFFRPSGPNPSFAGIPGIGGFPGLNLIAVGGGFPGAPGGVANPIPVPWSDVDQQESSGNSIYHGFTLSVSKRFSHQFELFSNWTWSHAIDDSTDLQTLLEPQNERLPNLERSSSTFDQRHRWVTNAVFLSPYKRSDEAFFKKVFADFTVSPIFDVSSGRPYTVLTGTDFNLNFEPNTDRPSVAPKGTPTGTPGTVSSRFVKGVLFTAPTVCPGVATTPQVPSPPFGCDGNLGRNSFTRPGFFTIDLRVARKIHLGERWNIDVIGEGFNLLNRFNAADVNPVCDVTVASATAAGTCSAGQPSAALNVRQFQFALKLNF